MVAGLHTGFGARERGGGQIELPEILGQRNTGVYRYTETGGGGGGYYR